MKKCKIRAAMSIAVCSFVVACAAPAPIPESADYGQYPDNYRQIVDNWMTNTLYDSHSVVDMEVTPPEKYVARGPLIRPTYGYLVQLKYNAKNAFGGYVGRQGINLLIRNGTVVNSWEATQ